MKAPPPRRNGDEPRITLKILAGEGILYKIEDKRLKDVDLDELVETLRAKGA